MKRTTVAIITLCSIILFSCKSKTNEDLITGKWKTEGMSVTFDGKGTLTSKEDGNSNEKTIPYKMINNGESLVTQNKDSDKADTVKIIELTGKILKILTPEKDTVVFDRVQ